VPVVGFVADRTFALTWVVAEGDGPVTELNAEQEHKTKSYVIVVNGTPHTVPSDVVSYEEVVKLAYPTPPAPNTVYSVTYEKAKKHPHEGDLVAGRSVEVKDGTEFDVTPTGKS
jgi:hypothetical protein